MRGTFYRVGGGLGLAVDYFRVTEHASAFGAGRRWEARTRGKHRLNPGGKPPHSQMSRVRFDSKCSMVTPR